MSLFLVAAAACVLLVAATGAVLWLGGGSGDAKLERRLRQAAAVLSGGEAAGGDVDVQVSVFRKRGAQTWLHEWIGGRFVMIEGRGAVPKAVWVGFLGVAAGCAAAALMQVGTIALVLLVIPGSFAAGAWFFLTIWDSRVRRQFIKQFPEVVDHIVRLSRAGLPPVDALSAVAEEASEPVRGVLQQVCDELASGLDPETVLRGIAASVCIPEFTLLSSALCLQRTTGGGVSAALGNLSGTLRGRLELQMKAQAATAQTRMTLLVLAAVPVVVVSTQYFTNPDAVDVLFNTESGAVLLRWGVGLVAGGLVVAHTVASRILR